MTSFFLIVSYHVRLSGHFLLLKLEPHFIRMMTLVHGTIFTKEVASSLKRRGQTSGPGHTLMAPSKRADPHSSRMKRTEACRFLPLFLLIHLFVLLYMKTSQSGIVSTFTSRFSLGFRRRKTFGISSPDWLVVKTRDGQEQERSPAWSRSTVESFNG